jgi:tetratricopeptide (TPR) repeat protein
MSEMLANQYFMARKYKDAYPLLEDALIANKKSKAIKRKLIICYTQTSQLNKALEMFLELIDEDIKFITDADPIYDDCPCPELVGNDFLDVAPNEFYNYHLAYGIIWLYCDIEHSLEHFNYLINQSKNQVKIQKIIRILSKHIKQPQALN